MAGDFNLRVEVEAETSKLDQGLASAEQKVTASGQKMAGAMSKAEKATQDTAVATEGFADKAAKLLAKIGLLEAGVRSVGLVVDSGAAIWAAATGDVEAYDVAVGKMADGAKSLPFGLGAVASAIESVASSILGVEAAQKKAEKAQERLAETERQLGLAIAFRAGLDTGNEALEDQIALLRAGSDLEEQRLSVQQQIDAELEKINEEVRKYVEESGRQPGTAMLDEIYERKKLLEEVRRLQLAEIEEAEKLAKAEAAATRAEEERAAAKERAAAAAAREAKEIAEAQADLADRLKHTNALEDLAIRKKRLELEGQDEALRNYDQEVELTKVLQGYNDQIAKAKIAGDTAEAARLARRRDEVALALEEVQALEDRLAIEKQAKAEAEALADAQAEAAKTRASAEQSVAKATATFSTAGGSFVSQISAQVNEGKLLRAISEKSRDLLAQIAKNTADAGRVGFA